MGDDRILRELLRSDLEAAGHAVETCASGHEAVELLHALDRGPVIVLIDLEMLDLSAWFLVEVVRSMPLRSQVAVALFASRVHDDEREGISVFSWPSSLARLLAWCAVI